MTLVVVVVVMAKRITGACAGNRPTRRAPDEIPRFVLTDDQRDKISRLSGISKDAADAWRMMESSIELYRNRKVHRQSGCVPLKFGKNFGHWALLHFNYPIVFAC
jgi:hypothetical protein